MTKSTFELSKNIISLEKEKEILLEKLRLVQTEIDEKKNERNGQSNKVNLLNDLEVKIALDPKVDGFYDDSMSKSLKSIGLIKEENSIVLYANKRILKSTVPVLINIIKAGGNIKVDINNKNYVIKLTEDSKIGIFEVNGEQLLLTGSYFSVKQAISVLNII